MVQVAFNRERKRHQVAQEQFSKDIAVATERQEEARANIRSYAASMAADGPPPEGDDPGPSWEEMTRSWIAEEDEMLEGVLHRALGPDVRDVTPRTPSMRRTTAARTPPPTRRPPQAATGVMPAQNYATEELATARSDPYPVPSPSHAERHVEFASQEDTRMETGGIEELTVWSRVEDCRNRSRY